MVDWSDRHPTSYSLIQRFYFDVPGAVAAITVPARSSWMRVAASGAGGFRTATVGWGGGAAYAFDAEACTPGDVYTGQVGDSQFAKSTADTVAGDSWIKRPGGSVLVYADRGRPDGTPGSSANCTGSIKRSGSAPTSDAGGVSAGDDADPYPLGFGGPGASRFLAPFYGAGGGRQVYDGVTWYNPPGDGRLCVEFYLFNPGYD